MGYTILIISFYASFYAFFTLFLALSALACSMGLKGSCVLSAFVLGLGSVSLGVPKPTPCN